MKERGSRTHVGLATFEVEDLVAFLWGKDLAQYVFVINEREYDLDEMEGDVRERVERILEFDQAFCEPYDSG